MATEPARGPQGKIHQQRTDGTVIFRPEGELDDAVADELRMLALEAHAPVIIDLQGCVSFSGSAIHRLAHGWTLYRPELCFVCPSPGDRRMLQRSSSAPLPVFGAVDDALAASSADGRFHQPDGTTPDGPGRLPLR